MTARLSWSIEKTRLILTVTDGPKTSHYTLTRSGSHEAQRATLAAVLGDMGGSVPTPPFRAVPEPLRPLGPVTVRSVSATGPADAVAHLESVPPPPFRAVVEPAGAIRTVLSSETEDALAKEILSPVPMTEERSLENLRLAAYNAARRNAKFAEDESVAERSISRVPEYTKMGSIPDVGVNDADVVGMTIDGKTMTVNDYREKPKFNIDNHED